MHIHIQKWGNSLALRIPKPFIQETHLKEGASVNLSLSKGKLILTPVRHVKYTLKKLLTGATKENVHPEDDFGPPVGKEIL